ncbi:hypothetical protein PCE1_004601 [Barthelona sp. PCE]
MSEEQVLQPKDEENPLNIEDEVIVEQIGKMFTVLKHDEGLEAVEVDSKYDCCYVQLHMDTGTVTELDNYSSTSQFISKRVTNELKSTVIHKGDIQNIISDRSGTQRVNPVNDIVQYLRCGGCHKSIIHEATSKDSPDEVTPIKWYFVFKNAGLANLLNPVIQDKHALAYAKKHKVKIDKHLDQNKKNALKSIVTRVKLCLNKNHVAFEAKNSDIFMCKCLGDNIYLTKSECVADQTKLSEVYLFSSQTAQSLEDGMQSSARFENVVEKGTLEKNLSEMREQLKPSLSLLFKGVEIPDEMKVKGVDFSLHSNSDLVEHVIAHCLEQRITHIEFDLNVFVREKRFYYVLHFRVPYFAGRHQERLGADGLFKPDDEITVNGNIVKRGDALSALGGMSLLVNCGTFDKDDPTSISDMFAGEMTKMNLLKHDESKGYLVVLHSVYLPLIHHSFVSLQRAYKYFVFVPNYNDYINNVISVPFPTIKSPSFYKSYSAFASSYGGFVMYEEELGKKNIEFSSSFEERSKQWYKYYNVAEFFLAEEVYDDRSMFVPFTYLKTVHNLYIQHHEQLTKKFSTAYENHYVRKYKRAKFDSIPWDCFIDRSFECAMSLILMCEVRGMELEDNKGYLSACKAINMHSLPKMRVFYDPLITDLKSVFVFLEPVYYALNRIFFDVEFVEPDGFDVSETIAFFTNIVEHFPQLAENIELSPDGCVITPDDWTLQPQHWFVLHMMYRFFVAPMLDLVMTDDRTTSEVYISFIQLLHDVYEERWLYYNTLPILFNEEDSVLPTDETIEYIELGTTVLSAIHFLLESYFCKHLFSEPVLYGLLLSPSVSVLHKSMFIKYLAPLLRFSTLDLSTEEDFMRPADGHVDMQPDFCRYVCHMVCDLFGCIDVETVREEKEQAKAAEKLAARKRRRKKRKVAKVKVEDEEDTVQISGNPIGKRRNALQLTEIDTNAVKNRLHNRYEAENVAFNLLDHVFTNLATFSAEIEQCRDFARKSDDLKTALVHAMNVYPHHTHTAIMASPPFTMTDYS